MAGYSKWPFVQRFLAGAFGTELVCASVYLGSNGVGVTDSTTTTAWIPIPRRPTWIIDCGFVGSTAATSAGGTVLAQLIRTNNTGTPTDVNITAATSIEADFITGTNQWYPVTITATDSNRALAQVDTLRLSIVAASTLSVQPNLQFVVELSVVQ